MKPAATASVSVSTSDAICLIGSLLPDRGDVDDARAGVSVKTAKRQRSTGGDLPDRIDVDEDQIVEPIRARDRGQARRCQPLLEDRPDRGQATMYHGGAGAEQIGGPVGERDTVAAVKTEIEDAFRLRRIMLEEIARCSR